MADPFLPPCSSFQCLPLIGITCSHLARVGNRSGRIPVPRDADQRTGGQRHQAASVVALCLFGCNACMLSCLSRVQLFATPWTVACQASPSMGFSGQAYWNGLPFPSPGDLLTQGLKPGLLHCRHTLYQLSPHGSPLFVPGAEQQTGEVVGASGGLLG